MTIAGSWSGTIQSAGVTRIYTMSLVQTDSAVTGTWTARLADFTNGDQGTISGSVGGNTFAGAMTINRCVSTTAVISGSASAFSMTWSSLQGFVGGASGCQDGTFAIAVTKQ